MCAFSFIKKCLLKVAKITLIQKINENITKLNVNSVVEGKLGCETKRKIPLFLNFDLEEM